MEMYPGWFAAATSRGPKESFTGTLWQDPIITAAKAPIAGSSAAAVAFEPSARTAWHTHPLGQTLYVTEGVGRFQSEGGPIHEIRPGDDVDSARGKALARRLANHRDGPSRDAGIAGGTHVTWLEQVTDAEFSKKVG